MCANASARALVKNDARACILARNELPGKGKATATLRDVITFFNLTKEQFFDAHKSVAGLALLWLQVLPLVRLVALGS